MVAMGTKKYSRVVIEEDEEDRVSYEPFLRRAKISLYLKGKLIPRREVNQFCLPVQDYAALSDGSSYKYFLI